MSEELFARVRAGIDWGRSGSWPPDAITALEELRVLFGTQSGTSVAADSEDSQNTGSKPEDIRKVVIGTDEVFRKSRFR